MVLEGTRGGETMVGRSREEKSGARKEGRGKGGKEKEAVEGGSRPAIRASPLNAAVFIEVSNQAQRNKKLKNNAYLDRQSAS